MILLSPILLFLLVYFAVRLAIQPMINNPNEIIKDNKDSGLVVLRDIGVFNNDELEDVISLFHNKGIWKENYEQYQKYAKILKALKEMNYLDEEKYLNKMDKLKKHFKMD
jgi:saccharopine dehydrogenase-like NADP-dependent oxidoreductase